MKMKTCNCDEYECCECGGCDSGCGCGCGKSHGFRHFLFGALVGGGIALLVTPRTGEENRKLLKQKIDELLDYVKNLDAKEVKENIEAKIVELKKDLEVLDKETVLRIAKEKAEVVKKKANELYEYAKEKATPTIEKATEEVRNKSLEVAKNVVKKLEDADPGKKKTTPKKSTKSTK